MTGLPSLAEVFFDRDGAQDNDTVHSDDSCCMSLRWPSFDDDVARWAEVLNQHVEAFSLLARQAHDLATREGEDGGMGGWSIGRPLLFAASHVVELALILRSSTTTPAGPREPTATTSQSFSSSTG